MVRAGQSEAAWQLGPVRGEVRARLTATRALAATSQAFTRLFSSAPNAPPDLVLAGSENGSSRRMRANGRGMDVPLLLNADPVGSYVSYADKPPQARSD